MNKGVILNRSAHPKPGKHDYELYAAPVADMVAGTSYGLKCVAASPDRAGIVAAAKFLDLDTHNPGMTIEEDA